MVHFKNGISGTIESLKNGISGIKVARKYGINGFFLGNLQYNCYLCIDVLTK